MLAILIYHCRCNFTFRLLFKYAYIRFVHLQKFCIGMEDENLQIIFINKLLKLKIELEHGNIETLFFD